MLPIGLASRVEHVDPASPRVVWAPLRNLRAVEANSMNRRRTGFGAPKGRTRWLLVPVRARSADNAAVLPSMGERTDVELKSALGDLS